MDIRLALMCGVDVPIPECQLQIHQPTIKEIAYVGEEDFFIGVQTLTISKQRLESFQGESLLENTNNFQIFMTVMNEKSVADKKFAVQQVLSLMFPKFKVLFTPKSLIFSDSNANQSIMIDESNFNYLQEVITEICCLKKSQDDELNYNPGNAKAREIAEKLMKGRKRVAQLKGTDNVSIFSQYLSSLTIGINGMNLSDMMNLTIYQLYDLAERYQLYIKWDIDIRSRLAGAENDKPIEDWMKNIH